MRDAEVSFAGGVYVDRDVVFVVDAQLDTLVCADAPRGRFFVDE